MAAGKVSTTGKRTKNTNNKKTPVKSSTKSTGKKKNTRTVSKKSIYQNNSLKNDFFALLLIVCSIILILANFNLAGDFGNSIKWFMFGLIGIIEYIFPLVVIFTILFHISNKEYASIVRIKLAAVYVLIAVLAAGWQRITDTPEIDSSSIMDFYNYSAQYFHGGGLIGGAICKMLNAMGTVGTIVILLFIAIICIMLITEKSVINGMVNAKKQGSRMVHAAKQDYDIYKEHSFEKNKDNDLYEISEEEYLARRRKKQEDRLRKKDEKKKLSRLDKKARGVTITTIPKEESKEMPDIDLKEISVDTSRNDEYSKDIYEPENINDYNKISDILNQKADEYINNYDGTYIESGVEEKLSDINHFEPLDENEMIKASENYEELSKQQGNTELIYTESVDTESIYTEPVDTESIYTEPVDTESIYTEPVDTESIYTEPINTKSASNNIDENEKKSIKEEITEKDNKKNNLNSEYSFPPIDLLSKAKGSESGSNDRQNRETAGKLQQTLQSFGVKASITDISCGPSVTRFELQPEQGVKVSKIVSLTDDIKLNLAATDIRIEAPIPGKAAVGIEVPNKVASSVSIRELIDSEEFKKSKSAVSFAVGKDIAGKTIVTDIAKMPHLLIAGATGSGKSVCINTIIMSILYKSSPEDVKMIMIDPKMVELRVYDGIPHLMIPVVVDPKKASGALNWAVGEMTDRYQKFMNMGVRDIKGYNAKIEKMEVSEGEERPSKMPQLVIIVDELADLMMVAPGEVEDAICRLAQLARAAGIHLVLATQRPSVNVITGLIKANIPSRIAFSVSSGVDSRTIIDMNGAEKLLGKGDMLFFPAGYPKPKRVQGAFVSDDEVIRVVDYLKENSKKVDYDENITEAITSAQSSKSQKISEDNDDRDPYFAEAGKFVIEKEKASIGMLQRYYKIGFNRAARIVDQLCLAGVVGPEVGTKPRKITMTMTEFEEYLRNNS